MSGGVPKRISISRTQSNTPSKAGNVMAKKAIVLCNGRRARTAMCNYVMKRTRPKVVYPGPGAGWTLVKDANFRLAVQAIYPGVIVERFEIAFNTYEYYFKNSTINTITDLGTGGFSLASKNISDLTGISGFTALTDLNVSLNNLTALNVDSSTSLIKLDCAFNQITSLNVTNNTVLTNLNCQNNQIPSLDLTTNGALEKLNISNDDVITTLNCAGLNLNELLLDGCAALTILDCNNNLLASLDVTSCEALTKLECYDNSLTSLDVTENFALTYLDCANNNISTFVSPSVANNQQLTYLNFANNNIGGTFSLAFNTQLLSLYCSSNNIPNFSGGAPLPSTLTTIDCGKNPLTGAGGTAVNVSLCTGLKTLKVNNSDISDLSCVNLDLNLLDVTDCSLLTSLDCGQNKLTSLDLSGCTGLTSLDCQGTQGLPGITSLDVSQQTLLTNLNCAFNQITSLDVSSCAQLTKLECYDNSLTSLDVTDNGSLVDLDCANNNISGTLNITNNEDLEELVCNNNALTGLQIVPSNPPVATALKIVKCHNNQITGTFDFTGGNFFFLEELNCAKNQITSLDVINRNSLKRLYCQDNQLTSLTLTGCIQLGAATGNDVFCNNNNIDGDTTDPLDEHIIITDFDAGDFVVGESTFLANPQNLTVAVGPYCQVADTAAVSYFNTNYANAIPSNGTYYS